MHSPRSDVIQRGSNSEIVTLRFPDDPNETWLDQTDCPWDSVSADVAKDWHNPDIWASKTVPIPGNAAEITLPENTVVFVSGCSFIATSESPYGVINIPATSSLIFLDSNIVLHTRGLNVMGILEIGSSTCRLRSTVNIVLHGNRADHDESAFAHKGIYV